MSSKHVHLHVQLHKKSSKHVHLHAHLHHQLLYIDSGEVGEATAASTTQGVGVAASLGYT